MGNVWSPPRRCRRTECNTYIHGWAQDQINYYGSVANNLENDNRSYNNDVINHRNWSNYTLYPAYNNAINNINRLRVEISSLENHIDSSQKAYVAGVTNAIKDNVIDINVIESEQERYKYLSDDNIYYLEFG